MKGIEYILLWSMFCVAICGRASELQYGHNNPEKMKRITEILDSVYAQYPNTKGISVHIEAPGYAFSWSGAVGYADSKGRILTAAIPANIASNTKTYIAATILRLVEQGLLRTNEPIDKHISIKSNSALIRAGYKTQQITIAHLLTNTSGIFDYTHSTYYQGLTQTNPKYRWTRDEQIELAMKETQNPELAGSKFAYSETNYLLLTEMIEQQTNQPFEVAVRRLLRLDELNLNHTWFLLQENYPKAFPPLAEQTAATFEVNSYVLDYSFDAFGGGGLASTVGDLAKFSQYLFNGAIFEKPATIELLYTTMPTADGVTPTYSFGLMHTTVAGMKAFGHGGFWGTQVKYIPELNLSIAAFVMERDTWPVYNIVIEEIVKALMEQ